MTRARLNYTDRTPVVASAPGFNPDIPLSGFYKMRLRSGAVFVGVRLWFGAPIEPWTGEEMDRAPRWNAAINGKWAEVTSVWPKCADMPIDAGEYAYLTSLEQWGREHAPNSPQANPNRRIDLNTAPPPF